MLLLQHAQAAAGQQRQQLCQQLRSWHHNVKLLLLPLRQGWNRLLPYW
jgi:hypothetical protein